MATHKLLLAAICLNAGMISTVESKNFLRGLLPTSTQRQIQETTTASSVPCLTEEACQAKFELLNTGGHFYPEDWPTKGCFIKNNNGFFGTGGTEEEMSEGPPGVQERLWCDDVSTSDGSTPSPTQSRTERVPEVVAREACLTEAQCRERFETVLPGVNMHASAWDTKGCFMKNGKAYFGTGGTIEEMSEADLPGVRERIWCDEEEEGAVSTPAPSKLPTPVPTTSPTPLPTTANPTQTPTAAPVEDTDSPTKVPTPVPTASPSSNKLDTGDRDAFDTNTTDVPTDAEPKMANCTGDFEKKKDCVKSGQCQWNDIDGVCLDLDSMSESEPVTTTDGPTKQPTDGPSKQPSSRPVTSSPSQQPTLKPVTSSPSQQPTLKPVTSSPSQQPTLKPVTNSPSQQPTDKSNSPVTQDTSALSLSTCSDIDKMKSCAKSTECQWDDSNGLCVNAAPPKSEDQVQVDTTTQPTQGPSKQVGSPTIVCEDITKKKTCDKAEDCRWDESVGVCAPLQSEIQTLNGSTGQSTSDIVTDGSAMTIPYDSGMSMSYVEIGSPSRKPSVSPVTDSPTVQPSGPVTTSPTVSPTEKPTRSPTKQPTWPPTKSPNKKPTESPLLQDTVASTLADECQQIPKKKTCNRSEKCMWDVSVRTCVSAQPIGTLPNSSDAELDTKPVLDGTAEESNENDIVSDDTAMSMFYESDLSMPSSGAMSMSMSMSYSGALAKPFAEIESPTRNPTSTPTAAPSNPATDGPSKQPTQSPVVINYYYRPSPTKEPTAKPEIVHSSTKVPTGKPSKVNSSTWAGSSKKPTPTVFASRPLMHSKTSKTSTAKASKAGSSLMQHTMSFDFDFAEQSMSLGIVLAEQSMSLGIVYAEQSMSLGTVLAEQPLTGQVTDNPTKQPVSDTSVSHDTFLFDSGIWSGIIGVTDGPFNHPDKIQLLSEGLSKWFISLDNDQVTLRKERDGRKFLESSIQEGQSAILPNWRDTGTALVIEVHEIDDSVSSPHAHVQVTFVPPHVEDSIQGIQYAQDTVALTTLTCGENTNMKACSMSPECRWDTVGQICFNAMLESSSIIQIPNETEQPNPCGDIVRRKRCNKSEECLWDELLRICVPSLVSEIEEILDLSPLESPMNTMSEVDYPPEQANASDAMTDGSAMSMLYDSGMS